MFLKFCSDWLS